MFCKPEEIRRKVPASFDCVRKATPNDSGLFANRVEGFPIVETPHGRCVMVDLWWKLLGGQWLVKQNTPIPVRRFNTQFEPSLHVRQN